MSYPVPRTVTLTPLGSSEAVWLTVSRGVPTVRLVVVGATVVEAPGASVDWVAATVVRGAAAVVATATDVADSTTDVDVSSAPGSSLLGAVEVESTVVAVPASVEAKGSCACCCSAAGLDASPHPARVNATSAGRSNRRLINWLGRGILRLVP